jgi:hypothetical protein
LTPEKQQPLSVMLEETEHHPLTYNDTQSDTSSDEEVVPEMSF